MQEHGKNSFKKIFTSLHGVSKSNSRKQATMLMQFFVFLSSDSVVEALHLNPKPPGSKGGRWDLDVAAHGVAQ